MAPAGYETGRPRAARNPPGVLIAAPAICSPQILRVL